MEKKDIYGDNHNEYAQKSMRNLLPNYFRQHALMKKYDEVGNARNVCHIGI